MARDKAPTVGGVIRGSELGKRPSDGELPPTFPQVSHPKKRLFLTALASGASFGSASTAAGVDRRTGLNWRRDMADKPFQAALAEAVDLRNETLEAELWRRGRDGVERPVYQGGRLVGTVQEFDTTALIFALKGAMPDKYRDNVHHDHDGQIRLPVSVVHRHVK